MIAPGIRAEDEATFEQRLREHETTLIAPLDHPAGIVMAIDSRLERDMRAGACAKEPETVDWLEEQLGGSAERVLYDVGACSGSYSLLAAKLRAKVVAIEPSLFNARQLARNAAINRADITIMPIALAARTEMNTLSLSSEFSGAAGHALVGNAPITLGHSVMVWRLDDLLARFPELPRPTHMKVDTDGSEADVLEGAPVVLAEIASVMVEVRSATRQRVSQILEHCGLAEVAQRRRIAPDTWNVQFDRVVLSLERA